MRLRNFIGAFIGALLIAVVAKADFNNPPGGSGSAPVPTMAGTGFSAFTDPQGSCTLADSAGGIVETCPSEGGSNVIRAICKPAPATPYSAIGKIAFVPNGPTPNSNDQWGGLAWRNNGANGSGAFIMSGLVNWGSPYNAGGIFGNNFTNYNTYAGSSTVSGAFYWPGAEIWFKLKDDGTNVTYSYSAPGDGTNFVTVFTTTESAGFLGAGNYTKICMFINAKANPMSLTLEQYKETSP